MNLFNRIFKYIDDLNIKTHIMPVFFISDIPNIYFNSIEYNIFCIRLFSHSYSNTFNIVKSTYNLPDILSRAFVIKYTDLINLYVLDKTIIKYILNRNIEIINLINKNSVCTYNICNIDLTILKNLKLNKDQIFFSEFLKTNDKISVVSSITNENNSLKTDTVYSFLSKSFNKICKTEIGYENRNELFRLIKCFKFQYNPDNISHLIINKSSILNINIKELLAFLLVNIHLDVYTSKNQVIICSKDIEDLITKNFKYSDFHNSFKRIVFIQIFNYTEIYKLLEFLTYSVSRFVHIVLDNSCHVEFVNKILEILKYSNREFIIYNLSNAELRI